MLRRLRSAWTRFNYPNNSHPYRQPGERPVVVPDDVPTAAPARRPAGVLVELPEVVLDLGPLSSWGFNEGPTGRAGQAVLTSLACAAEALDQSITFAEVLAAAIEKGISDGDLDHRYVAEDPDGHYDNTWLETLYRTPGLVLEKLQNLSPHQDAAAALQLLTAGRIRVVGIPFLGTERTELVLAGSLSGTIELPTVSRAGSLPELLTSLADQLGVARDEIAVVAGSVWMASAAMQAGFGTVWVDRRGGVRAFSSLRGEGMQSFRWSLGPPVPALVDDLSAAVRLLLDLGVQ